MLTIKQTLVSNITPSLVEVITGRSLTGRVNWQSSRVRKKEESTQTDSSSKFIKIAENLRAASHAKTLPKGKQTKPKLA